MATLAVVEGETRQACDVVMGEQQAVSDDIARALGMKAYCTIDLRMEEDALDNIYREAKSIDRLGGFKELPAEIADGLLGVQGSARFSELPVEDVPEGMQKCDELLNDLFNHVAVHVPLLGFYARTRTTAVVLEAEETPRIGQKPPALGEEHLSRWLSTFETGRLLMLVFMGPGLGKITLKPFEGDTKPFEVPTYPGMAMVLRSDVLSGRHIVSGRKGYALGCFLVQDGTVPGPHAAVVLPRPPLALKLDEWSQERLRDLATVDVDELDKAIEKYGSSLWWRSAYDHTYHSSNKIAVRGVSVKFPCTHDPEEAWATTVPGSDVIIAVPSLRWDLAQYYDPDPDSWKMGKLSVMHGGFMDGAELFDAKFFKIAPGEVKGMDPMQRLICDSGYEALKRAGRTKANLLNSATGVFVAAQMAEVNMIDAGPEEAGGCEQRSAGTGISTAIMSNRLSFVMGMQGPSVMVDTDASSSLMTLQLAMSSCFPGKVMSTMATATGIGLMMTPLTWLGRIASGEMTNRGRCFSFDASSNGWIRSDGIGTLAVDNFLDRVNDQLVHDESRYAVGIVSGCTAQHVGQVATLNTPSAAATMKCMLETCRNAGVALTSIDAVEAHADAQQFHDAVEGVALRKVVCSGGEQGRLPVVFGSAKSNYGNSIQCAGMVALVKRMYEQKANFMSPTVHLREMNPYISYDDPDVTESQPAHFATEVIPYPYRTSLTAISGQGFGGTIGSAVITGYAEMISVPRRVERPEALTFWPGGGGKLENAATPVAGYDIVGSWSSWLLPERMELDSEGVYEYTVTLGVNGSEQFRILLDGDYNKSLHPGTSWGASGQVVCGPAGADQDELITEDEGANPDFFWSIEGSTYAGGAQAALEDGSQVSKPPSAIGDKYRVRLQVAGKWRVVTWERIPDYVEKAPLAQLLQDPMITGTYFLTGSFNNWQFEEMSVEGGRHCAQIKIEARDDAQFLVVRNKDMNQTFCPGYAMDGSVEGPLSYTEIASGFELPGVPGDVFRVQFQRTGADGEEDKQITFDRGKE